MSIIVKGMEMPENCWECVETDLNIAVSVFGGMCPYCEKIRTDHDMQTGRHPECPLGALPDHHGRLVDVDKIIVSQEECNDISSCQECRMHVSCCADMEEIIRNATTIVEAEDES